MASPQPAVPRATGFLRAYSRRQNKPKQAGKVLTILTSSLRQRGTEGRQRRRRRAPWDVSRGQQRWLHAAEAPP